MEFAKGVRGDNAVQRAVREPGRDPGTNSTKIQPTCSRDGLPFEQIYACKREGRLFLPGALLVAIGAQLLAAFMFVNLRFPTLLQ